MRSEYVRGGVWRFVTAGWKKKESRGEKRADRPWRGKTMLRDFRRRGRRRNANYAVVREERRRA